jgi:hypothetical protein
LQQKSLTVAEATSERRSLIQRIRGKKGEEKAEMSFIDHLEELRWHVIRAVLAVIFASILVFFKIDFVVDKILTNGCVSWASCCM